jgi:HlyD family secretion protein
MEKKKRAVLVLGVLVIAVGGYFLWNHFFTPKDTAVEASGTVEATTVELTAKTAGTIKQMNIQAGDLVQQGDLIAQIQRKDLEAQAEKDALNVAIAQNKLDEMLSGPRAQEIKQAETNVNIKQAAYDQSQKDLERAQELQKAGSISATDLEVYQNNQTVALNQLEAAQAALSLTQAGARNEEILAAENQVKMLKAVNKASQSVLDDLKIISPIKGTVQTKNFEEGEYIPAGASVATVANLDTVWINVYIPTDDLPYVKAGEKALVSVSGLDKEFAGKVTEIATKGEFTPKTIQTKKERANIVFKVKIEVKNAEGILKPGMPADVTIDKNQAQASQAAGAQ